MARKVSRPEESSAENDSGGFTTSQRKTNKAITLIKALSRFAYIESVPEGVGPKIPRLEDVVKKRNAQVRHACFARACYFPLNVFQ